MKIFCFFISIFLLSTPLYAFEPTWNISNTLLELQYQSVHTTNWLKSKYSAQNSQFEFEDPVLGSNPSLAKINLYYLATGLSHLYLANKLPTRYRTWFQYASLSLERSMLLNRFQFNFEMRF